MKKIFWEFLIVFLLLALAGPGTGLAQANQNQDQNQRSFADLAGTGSAQGNQVQNKNQVQTKNQGEETQLQIATQQMEQLMVMEGLGEEVQEQIRELAQEQTQAQGMTKTELDKVQSRSQFAKKLFGPDYKALDNLRKITAQNKLRIQRLEKLQNQVANQADEAQLQEAVQALIEQNTGLEQDVEEEEAVKSLFGWLARWLNRE